MATVKAQKLKEDAHRKKLEQGIEDILSKQELVVEELHKLLAKLDVPAEKPKWKSK